MARVTLFALLLAVNFIAFPAGLWAQGETTSAIVGEVTDASGAAVPGATLTVTNQETGLERTATTDASGRFDFPAAQARTLLRES
jgi:hypothetical protein